MARYFSAPKPPSADDDGWVTYPLLADLHVPDHRPIDTGLIDVRGDAIMRAPNPIGFGRDGEW